MTHEHILLDRKVSYERTNVEGRSQDGGGIGRGDHFLFYKFIERTTEWWTKFTKQLLITSSGHQAPRKAAHCLRREANRLRFLSKDVLRPGGAPWGRGGKRRGVPLERAPSLWLPGQNMASAPHTQRQLPAEPRPPRSRTELANLNKRSPPPACVRAVTRHRREGKQKPDKQRESLQKGPVQQVKIPEGNNDYTGRGLEISRSVSWKKELSKIELNLHWLQQLQRNS